MEQTVHFLLDFLKHITFETVKHRCEKVGRNDEGVNIPVNYYGPFLERKVMTVMCLLAKFVELWDLIRYSERA